MAVEQKPSLRKLDNPAATRLRKKIRAAIDGMTIYWQSDDGDSEQLADAMTVLRQQYARDLHDALETARQHGYLQGWKDRNDG